MKNLGKALVFLAELGMLAGLALWGFSLADGTAAWALAVAVPGAVAAFWGVFLSPRALKPLQPAIVPIFLRLDLLLLGAAAAYFSGAKVLGITTAAATFVGTMLAGSLSAVAGGGMVTRASDRDAADPNATDPDAADPRAARATASRAGKTPATRAYHSPSAPDPSVPPGIIEG